MPIDESQITEICTEAVYERGQTYRTEGRIGGLDRFGDIVTADVQGTRSYDVTVDCSAAAFDATCTCPYDGPGECKHVVAVLLEVAKNPPGDERDRIESLVEDVSADELRSFLLDSLARDAALRERFRAQFDDAGRSVDEYRSEIDQLFDEHTAEYPVVTEAIDFSRFLDMADQYRSRGRYREAATVYRAIAEGIDRNEERIDAAYDHYARTFRTALDGYVECVQAADMDADEYEEAAAVLAARAGDAVAPYAEQYRDALDTLDGGSGNGNQ